MNTTTILLLILIVLLIVNAFCLAAIFCAVDNFCMWMDGKLIVKGDGSDLVRLIREHFQKTQVHDKDGSKP